MTHALFCWRVIHPDAHRPHGDTCPCGKHQQLQLGLIARGNQSQAFQRGQRIESESALRVGQGNARLQLKPEVREAVGKRVLPRHVFFCQIATAHDDGRRVLLHLLQQEGNIIGKMLTVGIDGHRMGKAHLLRLPETSHQRMTLTLVHRIRHHGDTRRELSQNAGRLVGTAIVHHDHLVAVLQHIVDHLSDRSSVVIRWNDRTDIAGTF